MQIFISWSGLYSQDVAIGLKEWIPTVIQAVEPYVSSEDIQKGSRWFPEISNMLENINFCIVCLTPFNLNEPWILFEAGALSKSLDQARVAPVLIGVPISEVKGPLSQFQATTTEKDDIKKLIKTINSLLGDKKLDEPLLDRSFERWWPDLDKTLNEAKSNITEHKKEAPEKTKRNVPDMLEEILELTRGISRQVGRFRSAPIFRPRGIAGNLLGIEPVSPINMFYNKCKVQKDDRLDQWVETKFPEFIKIYDTENEVSIFYSKIKDILELGMERDTLAEKINNLIMSELKSINLEKLLKISVG
jgi:hypothetical protein